MKRSIIIIQILLGLAACSPDNGPDSLSDRPHEGGPQTSCTAVCHSPLSTASPDPLVTNGTGSAGKHVAHVTSSGFTCDRCHVGYESNVNHMNGTLNIRGNGAAPVFFDTFNSATGIFTYVSGSPPSGTCANVLCHTGSTPDWYGADGSWTLPDCSVCHGAVLGVRRQIIGAAGDFASNPTVTSHHVAGGADPSTAQCSVCHDLYRHMTGTVRLRQADTGSRIDYDPAAPGTLEPFCVSCHDVDGAAGSLMPLADGVTIGTIPFVASTTIASSWSGSSIHRDRGLTCAGSGAAGTGCHGSSGTINMHGSTNKGLLANAMNFRIPVVSRAVYSADPLGTSYNYANYKLCFDCHESSPAVSKEVVLGFFTGGVYDIFVARSPFNTRQSSRFREHYDPGVFLGYNDTMFGYPYLALHNYHLLGFESRGFPLPPDENWLQWNYRGDPSMPGRITCTACHNVHGTTVPSVGSTHEALGLETFSDGANLYTTLGLPMMSADPMNCAVDCHGPAGQTSYWHTPGGE